MNIMAIYSNENITKITKLSHSEFSPPRPKSQKYLCVKYVAYTVGFREMYVTNFNNFDSELCLISFGSNIFTFIDFFSSDDLLVNYGSISVT